MRPLQQPLTSTQRKLTSTASLSARRRNPLIAVSKQLSARSPLTCRQLAAPLRVTEESNEAYLEMKQTYESTELGKDLGKEYGTVTGGPPKNRRAGIILHPTSLPGPYGIGEIGEEALRFVDWLQSAGLQCWQMLPLVPPEEEFWSPYTGLDALCGSTLLIALDELVAEGLLDKADLPPKVPVGDADFAKVLKVKGPLLKKAADRVLTSSKFSALKKDSEAFRKANPWVEDSALFYALGHYEEELVGKLWWTWPKPIRKREEKAMAAARTKFKADIERFIVLQFLFDKQWMAVKAYANERGVALVGDMPIYVGGQSADVWAHQELFALDEEGSPIEVSGVPPDVFSETGQLWGSPLYDWEAQKKDGYKWWIQRMKRSFELYDDTRIDHFRGFAGYWAVEASEKTAMNGEWKKGPATDLFEALEEALGSVPIIAEDLGVITADVTDLREAIGAPGMVILQFAWGSNATNPHMPHNHYENSVCYPGTHDNETSVGWWKDSATKEDVSMLKAYADVKEVKDIAWLFLRQAYASVSKTSIFLMQDVMRLDNSARMNFPGTTGANWAWRIGGSGIWETLAPEAEGLYALGKLYDRLPPKPEGEQEVVEEEGKEAGKIVPSLTGEKEPAKAAIAASSATLKKA